MERKKIYEICLDWIGSDEKYNKSLCRIYDMIIIISIRNVGAYNWRKDFILWPKISFSLYKMYISPEITESSRDEDPV